MNRAINTYHRTYLVDRQPRSQVRSPNPKYRRCPQYRQNLSILPPPFPMQENGSH
ncbi:hypothetical protein [Altericista sp. CCNU0014]|uniref:hypothetical protein n=1 Tax=Altericista sp. CCNU0014 TaxID=3082949 RepID=UPI00384E7F2E